MFLKRLQISLIHMAVAMTLVPINSTLNRVMIKELAMSATLVAALASLPYLFSPIQVAIGSFSDRFPLFGLRRTPYIVLGLLLCIFGVVVSPQAAFAMQSNFWAGLGLGVLAFGAWGMGYNFATVAYFSLATEISGPKGRARTIATMFFMMIIAIIFTATLLGRLVTPYTPANLSRAFWVIGALAFIFGIVGVLGLERSGGAISEGEKRHSWGAMMRVILGNRQASLFFVYLILLLTAILGQDLLLEPYGAEAFGMPVDATTRITSIWGTSFLVSLVVAGALEGRVSKFALSRIGAWGGMISFPIIIVSGIFARIGLFYAGVVLLGLATGLATVSNLSLMLDMTTASNVGLFIGAWGMAGAFARLLGNVLNGAVRDAFTSVTQNLVAGYQVVFVIETLMLFASLILLGRINVRVFQREAEQNDLTVLERAALAGEM